MDEDERAAILKRLSREGLSGEEKQFLARELESPLEMEALVAGIGFKSASFSSARS